MALKFVLVPDIQVPAVNRNGVLKSENSPLEPEFTRLFCFELRDFVVNVFQGNRIQADPVKPGDLLKSLDEIEIKAPNSAHSSSGAGHFSLFGIMRALFGENELAPQPGIAPSDPGGDTLGGEAPENPPKAPPQKPREHEPVPPPPEKYRRRLKEQLDSFLIKLTDDHFVAECTATRLVQSAAFLLAVALFGLVVSFLFAGYLLMRSLMQTLEESEDHLDLDFED